MKRPGSGSAWSSVLLTAFLFLAGCTGGLPPALKRDIAAEADKLASARQQVQAAQTAVNTDLARDPDLFRSADQPTKWEGSLKIANEQLNEAQRDDRSLENLVRRDRANTLSEANRLLAEERRLRTSAVAQSQGARAEADKWVAFKAALPASLEDLKHRYQLIHERSLSSVEDTVHKAEADWPAKKPALDQRLQKVEEIPVSATRQWSDSGAARQDAETGTASGADIALLIATAERIAGEREQLDHDSAELCSLSGQLYDGWDKILTNLDVSKSEADPLFRERIKTVRTHLEDVTDKKGTTSASEQWATVSEAQFHKVERDLGMAIAHKDAGLFDFEAQTTPEPPGFAYVATEQQGRNQYGYWSHDRGESVWHWLPEYLILRELLWNHDYRPVVLGEYRGYQVARNAGRTFYGQTTPASPPKYGTGGTFTAEHYAGSKYAQAGGFKDSHFASGHVNGTPSFDAAHPQSRPGAFAKSDGAGKRFGAGVGSPSGHRFGHSRSSPSVGRSFGRRR